MRRLNILALGIALLGPPALAETGSPPDYDRPPPSPVCNVWAIAPYRAYYKPHGWSYDTPGRPEVKIMSTQKALGDWEKFDHYVKEFKAGTFDYADQNNVVSGYYHERSGTYFVADGNHRIAAALEIAKETGDWSPFKKLVGNGMWSITGTLPRDRYSVRVKSTWGNFLGWKRFLSPITPRWGELTP